MGEDDRGEEPATDLPAMSLGEHVVEDYSSLRLSLKAHPLTFLRARLAAEGMVANARLMQIENGRRVTVAGLVLVRQRPGSARGVIFATLEDETGTANVIVWPTVFEAYRRQVLGARLLAVTGKLQREGIVIHVVAEHLVDMTARLAGIARIGQSLAPTYGRGDEAAHPDPIRPATAAKGHRPGRLFRS